MHPGALWSDAVALAAAFVLGYAALHDVAARTIPNAAPVALAALGIMAAALRHTLPLSLLAGVIALVFAIPAWRRMIIGGGDLKMLSAAMVLVPPARAVPTLASIAIAGGLCAAAYLLLRPALRRRPATVLRKHSSRGLARRALRAEVWRIRRGGSLPYGVAIAAGVAATLFDR